MSFDLQTPYWHLHEAAELARDFPEIPLILNHTGLTADRSEAGLVAWRECMEALAEQPNSACKISGIGLAGQPWTVASNRRVVLEAIEVFGVDRCMFASNFPVDKLCTAFETIFFGFAEIVADFDEAAKRKLFADNAVKYYRL